MFWEVTSVSERLEKPLASVQPDPCGVLAGALQNAVLHRSHWDVFMQYYLGDA